MKQRNRKKSFQLIKQSTAAASIAGMVFAFSPAHQSLAAAPDFVPKFRQGNPLMMPVGNGGDKPAFVDINNDGDLDLFIGNKDGTISYFENIGTNGSPEFELRTGSDSPLGYLTGDQYLPYDIGNEAAPAFVDIDGDGDMDLFVGEGSGQIYYFENIGTGSHPAFPLHFQGGTENPLSWVNLGFHASPSFVDIDGDGDMDFIGGNVDGDLFYLENTGTATAPDFTPRTGTDNPFNGIDLGYAASPTFTDIDGDGDWDLFVGSYEGFATVTYFENTGSSTSPNFSTDGVRGAFGLSCDSWYLCSPVFADIDGDGDMDAFFGRDYYDTPYRHLFVQENIGTATAPDFTQISGTNSPTWGFNVGYSSVPAFVDIDGDGDYDLFVGDGTQGTGYFENYGTSSCPDFISLGAEGVTNPFGLTDMFEDSVTAFMDIDCDGDMDLCAGEGGHLIYFENTGTATIPAFMQITGTDSPFNGIVLSGAASPAFVDIDGDADMDLMVGSMNGNFNYFENCGTHSSPDFTLMGTGGTPNPFGLTGVNGYAAPAFADIDGDGDMDMVAGSGDQGLCYFENTGTATTPAFTQITGTDNPFEDAATWMNMTHMRPAFINFDKDGDMDLFAGEAAGNLIYFENQLIAPPVKTPFPNLIDWNDNLVADFGDNGLWYHNGSSWNWMTNRGHVDQMVVWDGKLVVDFGPDYGLHYYDGAGWTWMSNKGDVANMITWHDGATEKLVVDFGEGRRIYTYNGAWSWFNNKDDVSGLAVWNNKLVVDFGNGRGVYNNDSTWHWMSNKDDIAKMVVWDNGGTEKLVVDFGGGRRIYTYNGAWSWLNNKDDVNDLAVWNNRLVVDFGAGRGLYNYDSSWHWMSNKDDTARMVAWNNGTGDQLAVDFGAGRNLYNYNGAWSWIKNANNVPEMVAWNNRLAVDFGSGVGVYNYNGAWNFMKSWSTAE